MIVLDILNKKGYTLDYKKTSLYKSMHKQESVFKQRNVSFVNKSMIDVFNNEIIYKSIVNENRFHNIYELFLSENFDLIKYLNYDEKRKIIINEFNRYIDEYDCFINDEGIKIYMPMYDSFINQRMMSDYQSFDLKQHKQYLIDYKITKDNPVNLYGLKPYHSSFSSLKFIKELNGKSYFYYKETCSLYVFDEAFISSYVVVDQYQKIQKHVLEQIVDVIEENDEIKLLEVLYQNHCILDKLYKKISKKVVKK